MIFFCYNKNDYCDHSENCDNCDVWVLGKGGKEVPSNADRIRAMSDEELKYIVRAVIRAEDCPMGGTECKDCVFHDLCLRGDYYYNNEEEWLKQPAEKGD